MKKGIYLCMCVIAWLLLSSVMHAETVTRTFYFDFGSQESGRGELTTGADVNGHYWNNIGYQDVNASHKSSQTPVYELVDASNTATSLTVQLTGALFTSNGKSGGGGLTSPDAGQLGDLAVATATGDYLFASGSEHCTMLIGGLDPQKGYQFKVFGSRVATDVRISDYTFRGKWAIQGSLQVAGSGIGANSENQNTGNVWLTPVMRPNANGEISLTVHRQYAGSGNYFPINCMRMQEMTNLHVADKEMYIDCGHSDGSNGELTTSPDAGGIYWNNLYENATSAAAVNLVYSDGTSVGSANVTITSAFQRNGYNNGGNTAASHPAILGAFGKKSVMGDYFFQSGDNTGKMKFNNLNPDKAYVFYVIGARAYNSSWGPTVGKIKLEGLTNDQFTHHTGGDGLCYSGATNGWNEDAFSVSDPVFPKADGEILLSLSKERGSYFHINGIRIEEYSDYSKRYIAGSSSLCDGVNWNHVLLPQGNSITFENVATGEHEFKITDGSWGDGHEFTTVDYTNCSGPVYGGDGSNIFFNLSEQADVTVAVSCDDKITVRAKSGAIASHLFIAGNASEMGSWSPNKKALTNDQITFSSLPAGDYEFKLTNGSWDKAWGYSSLDQSKCSPAIYSAGNDGSNIGFSLTEATNVTVKLVSNKVVVLIDRAFNITGNGATKGDGTWCGGNAWWAKDNATKLDDNLSLTFHNLPASSGYKFKVKDWVDVAPWVSANVFGYDRCDLVNSYACYEDNDNNICFDLALPADVTIKLVDNKVVFTTSPVYFITGNGNSETRGSWCDGVSWNSHNADSRFDPETYSRTYSNLPAGNYEFHITNGNWVSGGGTSWNYDNVVHAESSFGYYAEGNDRNIMFELTQTADVTIQFDPETGNIIVTSSNECFDTAPYSIVGETALVGKYWDNTDVSTEMTAQGDGSYVYETEAKSLSAGTYQYKVITKHYWDDGCVYPVGNGNNNTLTIDETGIYDLTYTFIPATKSLTCVAHKRFGVTISQYQYSTFYSDKAYRVPEGLKALIFTGIENEMLVMESIDVIPANTGVVLYGAANATFTLAETETDVTYPTNLLHGTLEETEINNGNVHYILGLSQGECGMFWPHGTTNGVGAFTNQAGKAYLELPGNTPAPARIRGFVFSSPSVATGVYDAEIQEEDGTCYDLLGRKVSNPQQGGLYIMNGKKVIIL